MYGYKELLVASFASAVFLFLLPGLRRSAKQILRTRRAFAQRKTHLIENQFYPGILCKEFEVQEEVFQRIALDLHDKIGHSLAMAAFCLSSFPAHAPPDVEKIQTAVSLINGSIADLRHVCKSLNSDHISSGGLLHAIRQDLSQLHTTGKFQTQLLIAGTPYDLADFVELMIFRIIQECLTNILRHSQATSVVVRLKYLRYELRLQISDNGEGFCVEEKLRSETATSGLRNITKRCRLLGTSPAISSGSRGTSITIKIPRQ